MIFEDSNHNHKTKSVVKKAMVLVSNSAHFRTHQQILQLLHQKCVVEAPTRKFERKEEQSLEFYLSVVFHHLYVNASNLQFTLMDGRR